MSVANALLRSLDPSSAPTPEQLHEIQLRRVQYQAYFGKRTYEPSWAAIYKQFDDHYRRTWPSYLIYPLDLQDAILNKAIEDRQAESRGQVAKLPSRLQPTSTQPAGKKRPASPEHDGMDDDDEDEEEDVLVEAERDAIIDFDRPITATNTLNTTNVDKARNQVIHGHYLNPMVIANLVKEASVRMGVETSSPAECARIHEALSDGVYLHLKDLIGWTRRLSEHRVDATKSSQVVETTLDLRRGLVSMDREQADRMAKATVEKEQLKMKELESRRKNLTGEEAKQATEDLRTAREAQRVQLEAKQALDLGEGGAAAAFLRQAAAKVSATGGGEVGGVTTMTTAAAAAVIASTTTAAAAPPPPPSTTAAAAPLARERLGRTNVIGGNKPRADKAVNERMLTRKDLIAAMERHPNYKHGDLLAQLLE